MGALHCLGVQTLFSEDLELSGPAAGSGRQAATPSEMGDAHVKTPQRGSVGLHRRYYALLRRSRLMAVAFWAAMAYFVFWAVPWFPGGLSEKDYTERVAFTLVLGGICALLGVSTLVLREYLRRTGEALTAWTTVYDGTTGLYNRRYFYDRLSLECERARRQGTTFSLIVMHFEHAAGHGRGPSADALQRLGTALTRAARSNDLVAVLGANELAVVALGVSRKMVPQVTERLKRGLEGSLTDSGERLDLRMGTATYGARCRHPSTLLRLARGCLDAGPSLGDVAQKEKRVA
jgi:diguanylate cyclase (GGDEF)-like protein